jgi:hypothetical protein
MDVDIWAKHPQPATGSNAVGSDHVPGDDRIRSSHDPASGGLGLLPAARTCAADRPSGADGRTHVWGQLQPGRAEASATSGVGAR